MPSPLAPRDGRRTLDEGEPSCEPALDGRLGRRLAFLVSILYDVAEE